MPATTFISHQSRSVGYYLWPHRIPLTVWQNRQLIRQMVGRAVASRYRGSVLGLLWSFLLPLIMLAVYTFVFSVVFRARWGGDGQESKVGFALTLFCGLLLYNVFAECAGGSAGVIQLHANFVKKVVFPLEILPVVTLGAALFNALVSVVILLLGVAVFQQRFPVTLVYFPAVVLPLALLSLGAGWFLASVSVYVRDTGHVVTILLQMLMFLTPLFYPISAVPEPFRVFMRLNPLSTVVENARCVLMQGRAPEWLGLGLLTLAGVVVMQLGYVWFMKTKRGFADVV